MCRIVAMHIGLPIHGKLRAKQVGNEWWIGNGK